MEAHEREVKQLNENARQLQKQKEAALKEVTYHCVYKVFCGTEMYVNSI